MPFRWAVNAGAAFARVQLVYRGRSTNGIMGVLAAPLVMDLGCDRIHVYEDGADGNALVCFSANGSEVFRIEVRREAPLIRIEIAAARSLLVRSLPLCRRYFDQWFDSPPACEEISTLLASLTPKPRPRSRSRGTETSGGAGAAS
jgi:hypothetical protein